jgi:hypothetical protein
MTKHRLTCSFIYIALTLFSSGCATSVKRGINFYLVAQDIPPSQITQANLKSLELKKQTVISSKDILWYSRATHEMGLTPKAYRHIQNLFTDPLEMDGIPFVVCVGKERIYAGAFWTPLSSQTFNGVIIMQPIQENRNIIALTLGYPSIVFFKGKDPRSDTRIMQAFDAAGKLK